MNKLFIPTLADLKKIKCLENHEAMVDLGELGPLILCNQANTDMFPYTGKKVLVRATVKEKVIAIQKSLSSYNKNITLFVNYGYRHPEVQKKYYLEIYERLKNELQTDDPTVLEERTNLFIAHPSVAGHPTGGAIDVTLFYNGEELDMGCKICDFDQPDKIITYSDNITKQQHDNRMLLLDALKNEGFAPFYGEWWHYSYGDKEWAAHYNKPEAIYSQLDIQTN